MDIIGSVLSKAHRDFADAITDVVIVDEWTPEYSWQYHSTV